MLSRADSEFFCTEICASKIRTRRGDTYSRGVWRAKITLSVVQRVDVDPKMIDSTRLKLLKLIEELSVACPDHRFGQLVLNPAFLARDDGDRLAWDLEDIEFVEAAGKHLRIGTPVTASSRMLPGRRWF
jgi:hypothetical protein